MEVFFEVKTPLNIVVRTTREYWEYIISIKHPFMKDKENNVKSTLIAPDIIRRSKIDEQVFYIIRNSKIIYIV